MKIMSGIDLVDQERIKEHLQDRNFVEKVFHPSEMKYAENKKLASIFALKEAVFKALELPSTHWLDIEIIYGRKGKPSVHLSKDISPDRGYIADCSVSHENNYTIAFVVFILKEES